MKNKRWKRKAKRLKGTVNNFDCNCFFCNLEPNADKCMEACSRDIRELEKLCKQK